MTAWQVRDFEPEDLEQAVRLDLVAAPPEESPVFDLSEVVAALQERQPAVVATACGRLVGWAAGRVEGPRAWVLRLAVDPQWRGHGLGSALLSELEHRLLAIGARRLSALVPEGPTATRAFANSGFTQRAALLLHEKPETVAPRDAARLARLAGSVPPAGLWDQVAGMQAEKQLIERRVVLPLAMPEAAREHGVDPPRAVVLFGPPGTGKTTFAKAVASRLGWPFVELFPSRLATGDGGLAAGLSGAFADVGELDRVVVFIDEVEEVAGDRGTGLGSAPVVNELLKAIVGFRERAGRLLVCATNSVRSLDPAFLRHGRFDFVLPIGPPDAEARAAMWQRQLAAAGEPAVDVAALVHATDGFTPADIGHTARTTAQRAFERTVETGARTPAATEDYLAVVRTIRPTVNREMARSFEDDIRDFSRL
ncbi:MAG: ATP-binding protein [Kineosporiaceae bacterium]